VPQVPRQLAPAVGGVGGGDDNGTQPAMQVCWAALHVPLLEPNVAAHPFMQVPSALGAEVARQFCLQARAVVRAVWMHPFFCMLQPTTHWAALVPAGTAKPECACALPASTGMAKPATAATMMTRRACIENLLLFSDAVLKNALRTAPCRYRSPLRLAGCADAPYYCSSRSELQSPNSERRTGEVTGRFYVPIPLAVFRFGVNGSGRRRRRRAARNMGLSRQKAKKLLCADGKNAVS
jgi:hypothetical protein